MELTPMRFKNYTWPHNPQTYQMSRRRRVAAHKAPFGAAYLQDLGQEYRVMRGEGTFFGPEAYQELRSLAEVFAQEGPGVLVHPVWQAERAWFVALELAEEPLPDYVRYTFEFWEDGADAALTRLRPAETGSGTVSSAAAAARTYTVKKGDTLWGIAKICGVTLLELIAANPQIKNPNLIYPGEAVKLP